MIQQNKILTTGFRNKVSRKSDINSNTFYFRSGGNGPGMGYRADGTVVARASLPEFATSRVVNCYDIYLTDIYRNLTILSLPLEVWMFSGHIRPSRIIPSNLFCLGIKR